MNTTLKTSMHAAAIGMMLMAPVAIASPILASGQAQTTSDDTLKNRIEYRLETTEGVKKYDLKVKVNAGVAMLKGTVATADQKAEAGKLADIKGVIEVNNQIAIDKDADKTLEERAKTGMRRTGEAATDAWITTKVKWFHAFDELLDGSHIDINTKNRVVTLNGTVKTAAGKRRAVQLASNADGVVTVVDNLTIAGG